MSRKLAPPPPSPLLTFTSRLSEAAPLEKEFSEFMNFNQFEGNVGILWTTRAYGAPDAYNAVVLDLVPGSPASKNGLVCAACPHLTPCSSDRLRGSCELGTSCWTWTGG